MNEELYKGFDLSEFGEPGKAQALIDFLNLDGENDTLTETGYRNYNDYSVNQRKVKRGTSPQRYEEAIKAFKELLSPKQREMINSYLKLLGVLEWCECGKVKDKLYDKIKKRLDELDKSKDKTVKANLAICNKEASYPQNILYHLLWLPDKSPKTAWHTPETEEPDYVKNYRQAWFGQKVIDYREFSDEDDGEYMVLTDDEADAMCDDYIDEDQWRQAVEAKSTWEGYDDWKETVINNDGRGSILNMYDGSEDEQEVDGTTYYIYRTN